MIDIIAILVLSVNLTLFLLLAHGSARDWKEPGAKTTFMVSFPLLWGNLLILIFYVVGHYV